MTKPQLMQCAVTELEKLELEDRSGCCDGDDIAGTVRSAVVRLGATASTRLGVKS